MSNSSSQLPQQPNRTRTILIGAAILLAVFLLIKTAWVSDDAYISFRTVDNFLNGYGLRWNIAERVQVFTHPLWVLIMSIASGITGDVYFTSLGLSLILTIAVIVLIGKFATTLWEAVIALTGLLLSKAFIDYSTSGLENPLSHLLAVGLSVLYMFYRGRHRLLWVTLAGSLLMLTRLDFGLIAVPIIAATVLEKKFPWKAQTVQLLIGLTPLIIWELFSLLYYGYLVPNTAFAKLTTEFTAGQLFGQGIWYLIMNLLNDPLTLLVIIGSLIYVFGTKQKKLYPLAIGIILYLLYITKIGGDFMIGRFLSTPLVLAAFIISQIRFSSFTIQHLAPMSATVVLAIGIFAPLSPVRSAVEYNVYPSGFLFRQEIGDERSVYFGVSGLINWDKELGTPHGHLVNYARIVKEKGPEVITHENMGFVGYFAGPTIHIIDQFGLTDPLLSHLPPQKVTYWKPGHLRRKLPCYYDVTVTHGENVICDPALREYYEKVRLITRGNLVDWQRLKTIIKMNIGGYDHLVDEYTRNNPPEILKNY